MFIALGLLTGFLAGMLGIGGGVMLVPFLAWAFTASDFPPRHVLHMAVATSLATILFTSVSSIRAHHLRASVRWDIVRWMASGAAVGTFGGAQVASLISTRGLAIIFALFMGWSGVDMLRKARRPQARIGGPLPPASALLGVGGGIGFIASLIGAGGGFLTVPFLGWRGVPIREAVGTSAAVGFGIAVGGLIGYVFAGWHLPGMPAYTLGFIDLPALACCAGASVATAPIGVRAAHTLAPSTLKTVFATLLIGLALSMVGKAWRAA